MQAPAMEKITVPYEKTGYFTQAALDIHSFNNPVRPFVHRPFNISAFAEQIQEKSAHEQDRELLVRVLKEQYAGVKTPAAVQGNIEKLAAANTFTVTTGHQLCIFTGPLYFVYKIAHAISLCQRLKEHYPEYEFVPVYWMASEDHDFAEVSSLSINGRQITWEAESDQRAVGQLKLRDISRVIDEVVQAMGHGISGEQIRKVLQMCYQPEFTLAEATRLFVNELFGGKGLVVLDGDHRELKQLFQTVAAQEIREQFSFKAIEAVTRELQKLYKPQLHPREINLFYFDQGKRKRIVKEGERYHFHGGEGSFSREELLKMLMDHPENFSPNVALRPLYQELLLPNLAYIGGGGELAYWLQLKGVFARTGIPFPILALRNSYLLVEADHQAMLDKLRLEPADLFLPSDALVRRWLDQYGQPESYSLDKTCTELKTLMSELASRMEALDPGLKAHVEKHWKKNERFVKNLELKLYRAAKLRNEASVQKMLRLREALFPGNGLQERHDNILVYLYRYGMGFIDQLLEASDPENKEFGVLIV